MVSGWRCSACATVWLALLRWMGWLTVWVADGLSDCVAEWAGWLSNWLAVWSYLSMLGIAIFPVILA